MSNPALSPDINTPTLEILSSRRVRQMIGDLSNTTIWRLRRKGEFPEPIQITTGRKGWRRCDIEQWIAARTSKG